MCLQAIRLGRRRLSRCCGRNNDDQTLHPSIAPPDAPKNQASRGEKRQIKVHVKMPKVVRVRQSYVDDYFLIVSRFR
jgi:hypothetical protein